MTSIASLSSTPAIAQSGLRAAQVRLDSSAHNIANLNTEDFRSQTVQADANPQGGVVVSLSKAAEQGVNLEQEVVDQMSAKQSFLANVQVLKTADQMMGTLLDEKA